MKMGSVYEELDEAKSELEKLREQYCAKAELAESLKKAQNDQQSKAKAACARLEKLDQELSEKNDELFTAKKMNEELKSRLTEKESIIKNLAFSHDKLRVDFHERLSKCEEENKTLVLSLDEANAKNMDRECEICALKQEMERVKGLLTVSQKKFSEIESIVSKETRGREDTFVKLEEEKRKFEEALKWKNEQFENLKEAHEKLLNQVRMREKERKQDKEHVNPSDDQNAKNDHEQISALKREIEGLKKLLTVSQNKCSEIENRASEKRKSKEDDFFEKLDEENQKFQNQLKWKNEQFDHLKEAYEKLLKQFKIKEEEWEKNKELAMSPNDANVEIVEHEQQFFVLRQEIEGLKGLLSDSQKQRSEIENKASKERGGKEDVFLKLEEENQKFQNQLKWKKEQFGHLQEAHEKLKNEFKTSEKEWEKERARLLDGLSSLETNLESQIRNSQDLQRRLEMCNQALAHVESKRNLLEVQLSESRKDFDSICGEYEDSKSKLETMNTRRDQEITTLRSEFTKKDVLYKEMEYQFRKVEQEKQDMLESLNELQEARIQEAGKVSSASKVQNKLKSLENVHRDCLANLQVKESEWCSRIEKLAEEVSFCKSAEEELKVELESRDSLILKLELLNQESSFMLLVLKLEFLEMLADNRAHTNWRSEEIVEKKAAFDRLERDLEVERERGVVLSEKVQTLENSQEILNQESSLLLLVLKSALTEVLAKAAAFDRLERDLHEEWEKGVILLERVKKLNEMLDESSTCRINSEKQVLKLKSDLDIANEELDVKFCEANELGFELQVWKSVAKQLEVNLERNNQMRREVEASLLAQTEVEQCLKLEKESLGLLLEEKEKRIDDLQRKISKTENEEENWVKNEYEQLVEEKDQRISDLQQLVANLEKEFESSTSSFSSRLFRMQEEANLVRESWEKIKEAEVMKEVEIQEKNMIITELENDLANLVQKMELQSEKIEQLSVEDMKLMRSLGKMIQIVETDGARFGFDIDEEHDPVKENRNVFSSPLMKRFEERSPLRALNQKLTREC